MDEALNGWLKTFNIVDFDLKKLKIAFTHSSIKGLVLDVEDVEDYERLEFLGDAVLDLIVSEKLFLSSKLDEDTMTTLRSHFVKTESLSEIFDLIDVKPFIKYVGSELQASMKEGIIEAFFGVLYLEKGYKKCQDVWDLIMERTGFEQKIMDKFFGADNTTVHNLSAEEQIKFQKLKEYYSIIQLNTKRDAISILQELSQNQWKGDFFRPEYINVNESGPPHNKKFEYKVEVKLNFETIINRYDNFEILKDLKTVEGFGKSSGVKSAKMKAAQDACDKIFLSYLEI